MLQVPRLVTRLALKSSPCFCPAEPKVVSIGFKQEVPAPVRKPQPPRADASHSTGEEPSFLRIPNQSALNVSSMVPIELAKCVGHIQAALHLKGWAVLGRPWEC